MPFTDPDLQTLNESIEKAIASGFQKVIDSGAFGPPGKTPGTSEAGTATPSPVETATVTPSTVTPVTTGVRLGRAAWWEQVLLCGVWTAHIGGDSC